MICKNKKLLINEEYTFWNWKKIEKLWSLWLDKRRHARCVSLFQMLRASVIKIINYQNPFFSDSKRSIEVILAAEL